MSDRMRVWCKASLVEAASVLARLQKTNSASPWDEHRVRMTTARALRAGVSEAEVEAILDGASSASTAISDVSAAAEELGEADEKGVATEEHSKALRASRERVSQLSAMALEDLNELTMDSLLLGREKART